MKIAPLREYVDVIGRVSPTSYHFVYDRLLQSDGLNRSLKTRMAAKIIANLIIIGSGVLLRAVTQAYRQAIVNAGKTGVAQETVQNMAHRVSKTMTEAEARLILGVDGKATWEEILKRYEHLFQKNSVSGSFYIQSKVQRAKECLEAAKQAGGTATG